jgi:hypothetical protein
MRRSAHDATVASGRGQSFSQKEQHTTWFHSGGCPRGRRRTTRAGRASPAGKARHLCAPRSGDQSRVRQRCARGDLRVSLSSTICKHHTLAAMDEARTEELARAEDDRRAARLSSVGVLQACVRRAAGERLPRRRRRPSPSWFTAWQDELLPLVARRNATLHESRTHPTLVARRARESARAALRSAVRNVKRVWLNERISSIATDCKQTGLYWAAHNELKGGLDRSAHVVPCASAAGTAASARRTRNTPVCSARTWTAPTTYEC